MKHIESLKLYQFVGWYKSEVSSSSGNYLCNTSSLWNTCGNSFWNTSSIYMWNTCGYFLWNTYSNCLWNCKSSNSSITRSHHYCHLIYLQKRLETLGDYTWRYNKWWYHPRRCKNTSRYRWKFIPF